MSPIHIDKYYTRGIILYHLLHCNRIQPSPVDLPVLKCKKYFIMSSVKMKFDYSSRSL